MKPVATKEESRDVDLSESETWSLHDEEVTERPFVYKTAMGKSYASNKSDHPGSPKAERIEWSRNVRMSPATVHHMEAVSRCSGKSTNEDQMILWMTWT